MALTLALLAAILLQAAPSAQAPPAFDPSERLLRAVEANDTRAIEGLLAEGADPNTFKKFRVSVLMLTAERGNLAAVRALLAAGASPLATSSFGQTALHFAVEGGSAEVVRALLAAGAVPDARAKFGLRPLHLAARKGALAIVEALLASGAKPDLAAAGGATPLHLAAQAGQLAIVERLLASGAEPSIRDDDGNDPRVLALAAGRVEVAERLAAILRERGLPVLEPTPPPQHFRDLAEVDWENRSYRFGPCLVALRGGRATEPEGACAVRHLEILLGEAGSPDRHAVILLHVQTEPRRSGAVAILYGLREGVPVELARLPEDGQVGPPVRRARFGGGLLELEREENGAVRTLRWRWEDQRLAAVD